MEEVEKPYETSYLIMEFPKVLVGGVHTTVSLSGLDVALVIVGAPAIVGVAVAVAVVPLVAPPVPATARTRNVVLPVIEGKV